MGMSLNAATETIRGVQFQMREEMSKHRPGSSERLDLLTEIGTLEQAA
jgi:hypothetical protein